MYVSQLIGIFFFYFYIVNEDEEGMPGSPSNKLESASSTGSIPRELLQAATYSVVIHYKEKGVEDLVTFTAAKKLNALLQVHCTCETQLKL